MTYWPGDPRYRIVFDRPGKRTEGIESHPTPRSAQRALGIFQAHERKCGRDPSLWRIEPPVELLPWEDVDLPDWAAAVLIPKQEE